MSLSLFSFWDFPSSSGASAVSFAASAETAVPPATWRVDLPPDHQAAAQELEVYASQAQASLQVIAALPERIDSLVARVQDAGAAGLSFSAAEQAELPDEESDLLLSLYEIDHLADQVSFGLEERLPQDWQSSYRQFQAAASRLLRSISHLAWVETSQGGQLLGRTSVGWAGDMQTFYRPALLPQQALLHQRSLEVALAARYALIRLFTATIAASSRLSLLLATPGGALLSLPAVWKYVNQILSEIEQYKLVAAR